MTASKKPFVDQGSFGPEGHGKQLLDNLFVVSVDGFLGEGDRPERCGFDITVYHTPGHTAGCLSYLITIDGETCLFSGDLIMSNGAPGWTGDPGFSRENIITHLRRLLAVEFTSPCHGHNCLLGDGKRWLRLGLEKAGRGEW